MIETYHMSYYAQDGQSGQEDDVLFLLIQHQNQKTTTKIDWQESEQTRGNMALSSMKLICATPFTRYSDGS